MSTLFFVLTTERAGATLGVEVTEMDILTPTEVDELSKLRIEELVSAINDGLISGTRLFSVQLGFRYRIERAA